MEKQEKETPKYDINAILQSIYELREAQKETDRQMKETDRQMKETDRQITRISKEIGGITRSNGKMAEEMIANSLKKDMVFAGIRFDDMIRNQKKYSKKLDLKGEFDIVMYNCEIIAIIEAKYKVDELDVANLIDKKKVEKFRLLFPEYRDYKIMLAIGGGSFEGKAEEEAEKRGIGIIKVVGDKVEYYTEGIRVY